MEEQEQNQKPKRNHLSFADKLKACTWLQQRAEEAARLPRTQVAQMMADHIGRTVTVDNLEFIADSTGVKLHSNVPEAGALFRRIEEMEKRLRGLEEEMAALVRQPLLTGAKVEV